MSELVSTAAHNELLILPRGKVRLHGIDFDEDFFVGAGFAALQAATEAGQA
jgi:hypothetical protein